LTTGGQMPGSDYPPGFRMPFNMQAPGPWALRGPRPKGERRGPGRPRLNTASGKPVNPMMERSISAPSMPSGRSRMMSPGLSPFSSGLGSTPGSIPSPDMDGMPQSPGVSLIKSSSLTLRTHELKCSSLTSPCSRV
jgi:hypothetical protein